MRSNQTCPPGGLAETLVYIAQKHYKRFKPQYGWVIQSSYSVPIWDKVMTLPGEPQSFCRLGLVNDSVAQHQRKGKQNTLWWPSSSRFQGCNQVFESWEIPTNKTEVWTIHHSSTTLSWESSWADRLSTAPYTRDRKPSLRESSWAVCGFRTEFFSERQFLEVVSWLDSECLKSTHCFVEIKPHMHMLCSYCHRRWRRSPRKVSSDTVL